MSEPKSINNTSNYKDINCCNGTRNIDYTLALYEEEKRRILDSIVELSDISNEVEVKKIWDDILSRDSHCMCHAGQYNKYTHYTCAPCTNLSRIVDLDKNILNKPFILECGERVGESFIVISLPIGKTYFHVAKEGKEKAIRFLDNHKSMLNCGTPELDNITFVQLDTFTNNVIIWWIINDLLSDSPFLLPLHTSYICRDVGFILSNAPTVGNYYHLRDKAINDGWILSDIAIHLAVILDKLSNSYFTHGNASLDTLVFSEEDIEYEYEDIIVSSSFVTHIVDFSHSSINIENVRTYPVSNRIDILLDYANLNIDIEDGKYRLNNKTDVIFNYIRHSGLPIYTSSFDFYCYLVSLMLDKVFYNAMMDNEYKAWTSIWKKDELKIIENRIKENQSKEDVDVVRLLGGLWLSCTAVKDWLDSYK